MDKPLKLEQARVIAKNYSTRIIPLETNILDALGVTRALQETVQADNDAIANIEILKSTLSEIESTLNGAGIEASNIKVTDLKITNCSESQLKKESSGKIISQLSSDTIHFDVQGMNENPPITLFLITSDVSNYFSSETYKGVIFLEAHLG